MKSLEGIWDQYDGIEVQEESGTNSIAVKPLGRVRIAMKS